MISLQPILSVRALPAFAGLKRCLSWMPLAVLFWLCMEWARAGDPAIAVSVAPKGEGFSIDAAFEVPVPPETAWDVMTDFDHMTAIQDNLNLSRVLSRDGNTWVVRQEGVAKYGFLSFPFMSEREIRLDPMKRILARSLSGSVKSGESEASLQPSPQGTHIQYHAEFIPDSKMARLVGAPFIRHEIEEQFLLMAREMGRRHARAVPPTIEAAVPGNTH